MPWELVNARDEFQAHSKAWDDLNKDLYGGHPLLDSRFVGPLVEHFASSDVLLARNDVDSRCHGMLLLKRRRLGVWTTFVPSQTQVAPALLGGQADLGGLCRQLPKTTLMLELLCQDPKYSCIPDDIPEARRLAAPHTRTISIGLEGTFDEYWGARSKGLRKNLRKYLRSADKEGLEVDLRVHSDGDALSDAFSRYADLESKGWKRELGTAISRDNPQGRFYFDMIQGFGAQGDAAFYELHLGGQLAATQMTISSDRMLITLKCTHDESLRKFAPGRVLDYLSLEHEFDAGRFESVEFYTDAGPEQLGWGTEARTIAHVTIFPKPWFATLYRAIRKARSFAGRRTTSPAPSKA
jgi:hypothetical protein